MGIKVKNRRELWIEIMSGKLSGMGVIIGVMGGIMNVWVWTQLSNHDKSDKHEVH